MIPHENGHEGGDFLPIFSTSSMAPGLTSGAAHLHCQPHWSAGQRARGHAEGEDPQLGEFPDAARKMSRSQTYGGFHSEGGSRLAYFFRWFAMAKNSWKWMMTGGTPMTMETAILSFYLSTGCFFYLFLSLGLPQTWPTQSSSRGSCRAPRLEEILSQPGSPERPRRNQIQGVLAWIVESTFFECFTGGGRWGSRCGSRQKVHLS